MPIVLSELQKKIADQYPGIKRSDVNRIIQIILSEVTTALCSSEFGSCEFRNFGRFSLKQQNARRGRNPATGDLLDIPMKKKIRFKASSVLLKRLNSE